MRKESCSSLRVWRECKRKYHYKYEQQIEPVSAFFSKSLVFGTLVHAAMEDHSGLKLENCLVRERDIFLDKYPMNMEDIEFHSTLALRIMAIWKEYWDRPEHDRSIKFIDCETEWSFPLQAGMSHVGKRDGYVKLSTGESMLYELKTASDAGENYKYRLWMDDQLMANTIALRHEGKPVDGALYDIVHKYKLRQKTKETLPEFLERIVEDYKVNASEYFERVIVREHMLHLGEYASEAGYESSGMMGPAPRPRTFGACEKFGSMCSYFELCSEANEEQRNGLIDFNYKKRPAKFSELTNANQGESNGNQEVKSG